MELLAAAFSAMLGTEVVVPDKVPQAESLSDLPKVSVHQLFRATQTVMRPQMAVPEGAAGGTNEEFEVNVRTLTGTSIVVPVTKDHTIGQVKAAVEMKEGISAARQRLVFNSNILNDDDTILGKGIPPYGTCFLIILGGHDATSKFVLDPSDLAPGYDYDFTNEVDDGRTYKRGDYVYHRPYGWKRFALNVKGRAEYGGDDTWLGPNGIRTETTAGEWPVSYHGTYAKYVHSIVDKGYKIGSRELHGPGVYSSPSIEMIGERYAQEFSFKGKKYKVALQNRVNPAKVDKQKESKPPSPDPYRNCTFVIVEKKFTNVGADYWRCPRHNPSRGIYDIRPYGILIREVKS